MPPTLAMKNPPSQRIRTITARNRKIGMRQGTKLRRNYSANASFTSRRAMASVALSRAARSSRIARQTLHVPLPMTTMPWAFREHTAQTAYVLPTIEE